MWNKRAQPFIFSLQHSRWQTVLRVHNLPDILQQMKTNGAPSATTNKTSWWNLKLEPITWVSLCCNSFIINCCVQHSLERGGDDGINSAFRNSESTESNASRNDSFLRGRSDVASKYAWKTPAAPFLLISKARSRYVCRCKANDKWISSHCISSTRYIIPDSTRMSGQGVAQRAFTNWENVAETSASDRESVRPMCGWCKAVKPDRSALAF